MADQTGYPIPASTAPALVGRERERATLRDALAALLAGHGSLVLIGGEAGIGKTMLAEVLLAEASAQGALVLVGRCYDLSETPPYGPWAEALARAPRDTPLPPPELTGSRLASQADLFAQVREYLAALAANRPVVLLLDDLHWADPASLHLLRVLARDPADLPLLLVAIYRVDELTRRHPLYALLPVLDREARAVRLHLRPLDVAALGALVAVGRTLRGGDAAHLVAWLHARAEGNALYTTQLLRAVEEEGILQPGTDAWILGDLGSVGLPAPLRQVLDARLTRLGDEPYRLLTLAAVIGQEVPLALWAAVARTAEEGLLDTIDAAGEAHLIAVASDGDAVSFAHALIREALYEGLVATRRRRVHLRAAEALLTTPHPDADAVAGHLQRAGDPRAAAWLVRAGARAQAAYAWLTAAERYEAALRVLGDDPAAAGERARLLLTLAQLRRYDQPERGLPAAEEAARLAAVAGDAALAAAARFDHGHLLCLAGCDLLRGLAAMASTLPVLEALPTAARAALPALVVQGAGPTERYHRGALVQWLAQSGRYRDALRHGAPCARREPGTTARGLAGLGMAYAALGRPVEARRAYRDARAAFLAAGQHSEAGHLWTGEFLLIVLPYETERRAEQAWLLAEAGRAEARAHGVLSDSQASLRELELALPALWLDGHWAEARRRVAASPAAAHPWLLLALIARAQGEPGVVWRMVRAHLPDGPATEPGQAIFQFRLTFLQLGADLALDAGDRDATRAWLAAHDRWLAWSGSIRGRAEGALGWAAYHRAAGDPAQAQQHAAAALLQATAPRQPLALLAAHRLLGELATDRGEHAAATGHLAPALALAEACAAPYERALTLLAFTELHAATGARDRASAALAEARAILESLEARPALARADALAARLAAAPTPVLPFGLSAREAEVLRLVAAGLPDAQVAARLFLSPYTVKAHLRAIYGKLGVPSRAAATRVAVEHGLA